MSIMLRRKKNENVDPAFSLSGLVLFVREKDVNNMSKALI